MLTHTTRWSHPAGNAVVPSRWQATQVVMHRCSAHLPIQRGRALPVIPKGVGGQEWWLPRFLSRPVA